MVDNLDEKLGTFREIWNQRVQSIDLEEIICDKLEEHMAKQKQEYDPEDMKPEHNEQSMPDEAAAQDDVTPDGPIIQFDLGVWQEHDIYGKIRSAFGDQGYSWVQGGPTPPPNPV